MSLIADALKAAQLEKSQQLPARPKMSPEQRGFFAYSQKSGQRRAGMPRAVTYGLIGLGALGLVAALVALLVSTSTPATTASAAPTPSPISAPVVSAPVLIPSTSQAADGVTPFSQAAPPLTQSDDSFSDNSPPASSYPGRSEAVIVPRQAPDPAPIASVPEGEVVARPALDTPIGVKAVATTPEAAVRRPAGTLRITMESPVSRDPGPLFQEALAAQRRGDVGLARDLYNRALARNPNNAELHNNVGTLYKASGELDRAEQSYRRAIALSPRLAAAWSNLGALLNARGRTKEATAALQQALIIDPANAATKVNLAIQYQAAGMHGDARLLLEEAVRANPLAPEPHYALAGSLEKLGDRQGAIRQYDLFLATAGPQLAPLQQQVRQHLVTLRTQ